MVCLKFSNHLNLYKTQGCSCAVKSLLFNLLNPVSTPTGGSKIIKKYCTYINYEGMEQKCSNFVCRVDRPYKGLSLTQVSNSLINLTRSSNFSKIFHKIAYNLGQEEAGVQNLIPNVLHKGRHFGIQNKPDRLKGQLGTFVSRRFGTWTYSFSKLWLLECMKVLNTFYSDALIFLDYLPCQVTTFCQYSLLPLFLFEIYFIPTEYFYLFTFSQRTHQCPLMPSLHPELSNSSHKSLNIGKRKMIRILIISKTMYLFNFVLSTKYRFLFQRRLRLYVTRKKGNLTLCITDFLIYCNTTCFGKIVNVFLFTNS